VAVLTGSKGTRVEETVDYKGVTLTILSPDAPEAALHGRPEEAEGEAAEEETAALVIDGQLLPTSRNAETGRHWTYLLPYQDFDSLTSLGKAVVDYVHGRAAQGER
jgi:hypothetical protein